MQKRLLSTTEVIAIIKAECKKHGVTKFADDNNIERTHIYAVFKGKRPLPTSIGNAVGFRRIRGWVRLAAQPFEEG
jgi:hypothetical protein